MKRKKIVILEPYGSYLGHPLRNIDIFSQPKIMQSFDYILFSDKKISKNGVRKFFISPEKFFQLNFREKISIRMREFNKIINKFSNIDLIFTTNLNFDIEAWLKLLNRDLNETLKKRELRIIIHSAYGMHYPFFKYKETVKNLNEFSNVRFSFFSELQTATINKLFPSSKYFTLYFPVYLRDKAHKRSFRIGSKPISYPGVFSLYKNPFFIVEIAKQLKRESFIVQLYHLYNDNFLLAREFFGIENVNLILEKISEKRYLNIINNSKFGILPYNKYEYSIRPSGIFEDYIMNEIPVFVTDDTWMAYKLKEMGLKETIFDGSVEDFIKKYDVFSKDIESLIKLWGKNIKEFRKKREINSFFKNLQRIFNEEKNKKIKKIPSGIFKRGVINYYTKGSEFYYLNGEVELAELMLEEMKEPPNDYPDYDYMKMELFEKELDISYYSFFLSRSAKKKKRIDLYKLSMYSIYKKNSPLLKKIILNDNTHKFLLSLKAKKDKNIFKTALSIYLQYFLECLLDSKNKDIFFSVFFKLEIDKIRGFNNAKYVVARELYYLKRYQKAYKILKYLSVKIDQETKDLIPKIYLLKSRIAVKLKNYEKAFRYLKESLKKCNKTDYSHLSLIYFYLGEIAERLKKKSKNYYYKKSLFYTVKIKHKTLLQAYRIASLYKRFNEFKKASYWFKRVLKLDVSDDVKSGAYFHLGEIEMKLGNNMKAKEYFERCLELNPEHRKAKEYLEELRKF